MFRNLHLGHMLSAFWVERGRARLLSDLSEMSDQRLAQLGLKRANLVDYVYRDV